MSFNMRLGFLCPLQIKLLFGNRKNKSSDQIRCQIQIFNIFSFCSFKMTVTVSIFKAVKKKKLITWIMNFLYDSTKNSM